MTEQRPGKIGRQWPAGQIPTNTASNNSAPTAQASVVDGKTSIVLIIVAVIALILAVFAWTEVSSLQRELDSIRVLLDSSAAAANRSAVDAALASERADKAERSAALNREYAVQVVGQLNRMGYPVISPGEDNHPPAQPEDYERLDTFIESKTP